MPRALSPRLLWLLLLAAVLGGLWMFLSRSPEAPVGRMPSPWDGPVAVRATPAMAGALNVQIQAIGTVMPLHSVTVRSRVSGELKRILFDEGSNVTRGTLLAEIDPEPYRVQLALAQGLYRQHQAQLAGAEEDLALYRHLHTQDSIAQQQLNQQEALVNQLRGSLQANQAQIDEARLQLSWTRIEAPIDGRLGLRQLDPGNLIAGNDAQGLVTITQMHPIGVQFTVPEVQLDAVRAAFGAASNGGEPLAVEALDRSARQVIATGHLTTLDNQIDIATGTLRLKAEFANDDNRLFPNQFVNVRLRLRTLPDAVTIPGDAVQYGSRGTYVFILEDGKSYLRPVVLGPAEGERVAVLEGVSAGEQVVLEGMERLRDGRDVIVVEGDSMAPAAAQRGTGGARR